MTDRHDRNAGPPQSPLRFALTNPSGAAVITIGRGLTVNHLTLVFANRSGKALKLAAGSSSGSTRLGLHFGSLLTDKQQAALSIEAAGWAAKLDGSPSAWSVAPTADTTLAPGAKVTFAITGVDASAPPSPGYVTIDYTNVGVVPDGFQQLHVARQNPPPAHALPLQLDLAVAPGAVIISTGADPQPNTLKLTVANPSPTAPLVPTGTKWFAEPPVFYLSFVYGAPPGGYVALTTADLARNMRVSAAGSGDDHWDVNPEPSSASPIWTLVPKEHEVLGVGEDGILELDVTNIVTSLPPGPTLVYLQHANVPGWADGVSTKVITKDPRLSIEDFSAVPDQAGPMGTPVTVKWTVAGEPTDLELRGPKTFTVTGKKSFEYPDPLHDTTEFTLQATAGTQSATANTTFRVVPPVIDDFAATPAGPVNSGDEIELAWETRYGSVTINGERRDASGSMKETPAETTTYVLVCSGLGTPVTRSIPIGVGPAITQFGFSADPSQPAQVTLFWTSFAGGDGTVTLSIGGGTAAPVPAVGTHPVPLTAGQAASVQLVVADGTGQATIAMQFSGPMITEAAAFTKLEFSCPAGINATKTEMTVGWAATQGTVGGSVRNAQGDSVAVSGASGQVQIDSGVRPPAMPLWHGDLQVGTASIVQWQVS